MTIMTEQPTTYESTPLEFSKRLQSARQAIGMDTKDAAANLNLQEKIIVLLESGRFNSSDVPLTFLRGYIRNYSKLLEIPDAELKEALVQLKPKTEETVVPLEQSEVVSPKLTHTPSRHRYTRLLTFFIVLTMIGLIVIWWHNQTPNAISPQKNAQPPTLANPAPSPLAELVIFLPDANLNKTLVTQFKTSELQGLMNQLNDYILKANTSYQFLNDRDTDMRQFMAPKKFRYRHTQAQNNQYQPYHDNQYNFDNQNNNETTQPE